MLVDGDAFKGSVPVLIVLCLQVLSMRIISEVDFTTQVAGAGCCDATPDSVACLLEVGRYDICRVASDRVANRQRTNRPKTRYVRWHL